MHEIFSKFRRVVLVFKGKNGGVFCKFVSTLGDESEPLKGF